MRGVNKVTLVGYLGKDPQAAAMPSGTAVSKFSVATNEDYKKDGEKVEHTEWHQVTAFGRLAEVCNQYLEKGSPVYLEGKLRTRRWEKEGQAHYSTEVLLSELRMLGQGRANGQATREPQSARTPAPAAETGQGDFDDDIPF